MKMVTILTESVFVKELCEFDFFIEPLTQNKKNLRSEQTLLPRLQEFLFSTG